MSRVHAAEYGTPVKGSKTEKRAKQAHQRVSREIIQLCDIINSEGIDNEQGQKEITFGELFSIYVVVSNKLVGVLLRARKHGLVGFDGETLFQGRDEKTKVTLNMDIDSVRKMYQEEQGDDFQWGKCMKSS